MVLSKAQLDYLASLLNVPAVASVMMNGQSMLTPATNLIDKLVDVGANASEHSYISRTIARDPFIRNEVIDQLKREGGLPR